MQAFRVPSRRPARCCASLGALLTFGQLCPTMRSVKGAEFERRVQKLAKEKDLSFVTAKGKGSHGRLYLGSEFTTLKDRKKEIGRGLLAKMCRDLKIRAEEL